MTIDTTDLDLHTVNGHLAPSLVIPLWAVDENRRGSWTFNGDTVRGVPSVISASNVLTLRNEAIGGGWALRGRSGIPRADEWAREWRGWWVSERLFNEAIGRLRNTVHIDAAVALETGLTHTAGAGGVTVFTDERYDTSTLVLYDRPEMGDFRVSQLGGRYLHRRPWLTNLPARASWKQTVRVETAIQREMAARPRTDLTVLTSETPADAAEVARQQHEQDIAHISAALAAEARRRSWCSEYDDVMQRINEGLTVPLTPRVQEYTVNVRTSHVVQVEAVNADEAARLASTQVQGSITTGDNHRLEGTTASATRRELF